MDFLNLVESHLCHGSQNVQLVEGRTLKCTQCLTNPIKDVYEFVSSHQDPFVSCRLAEAFARWTGDENVPVTFILIDVEGILPSQIFGQPLKVLREAVELYKAINSPFTEGGRDDVEMTPLMHNFLGQYIKIITAMSSTQDRKTSEMVILNQLMGAMHQAVESTDKYNPFENYFKRSVPYVKSFEKEWTLLPPETATDTLVRQLMDQMQRSSAIRKQFSQYSMIFDVMHVILGCYACSTNIQVVGNWVLDLLARVCRGQFFWKNYASHEFVQTIQKALKTSVSYRNRPELHYVIREIQQGNAVESLSSFLPQYLQLEILLRHSLPQLDSMVITELFPSVLFENYAPQAAFSVALMHVGRNMNPKTGQIKKGTYQTARKIGRVITKLIEQVKEFDSITIPWTTDVLKLFLVSNPKLEQELVQVANVVLGPEEEEEE
ncbi:hypothetical protein AVEN_266869-1 [Araneus ventricosus]|uniref:Uncharacterized protein n=1 Tax=Araneus ventricosus TaxID=182803 RepID=A0A4Y2SYU1_ARAVE|nr:hypothetical protein AVEN_266869-1 [Araneus ventricosus]